MPGNDDQDFDAAFNESAASLRSARGDGDKPAADDATSGDDATPKAAAPAAAPATQKPAASSPPAQAPAPKAAAAAPAPGPQGQGENAEPETVESLRAKLAKFEHQERSDAGRVGALQREINRLTSELTEAKKSHAAAPAAAPAPTPKKLDDLLSETPDLEAAVRARIEEVTGAIQSKLDDALARLAKAEEQGSQALTHVKPLVERDTNAAYETARAKLDADFVGWRDHVDNGKIAAWLQSQPATVRSMFPGRDFAEASAVLTLYRAQTGELAQKQPEPSKDGDQQDAAADARAAAEKRLAKAVGIAPRTPVPAAQAREDDFDGAFREATARLNKSAQVR